MLDSLNWRLLNPQPLPPRLRPADTFEYRQVTR